MSKRSASEPNHSARTIADKAARADRLADEMRKNLMKRKQQQRQKTVPVDGEDAAETTLDDAS